MALQTRTITIDPPAPARMTFQAKIAAGNGSIVYEILRYAAAGATSINLPVLSDRFVRYTVETKNSPGVSRRIFDLEPGASISLADLIQAGTATFGQPDYAFVNEAIAAALEDFEGGTGGGSIPFITGDGTTSTIATVGGSNIPFLTESGASANIPLD